MNDTLQTLIRSALKIGAGYAVAKGISDDSTAQTITAGIIALIGVVWGVLHRSPGQSQSVPIKPGTVTLPAVALFLAILAGGCVLTGCATAIKSQYITSVSNKGFGVDIETANQGNGTPTVKLGFFSSRVMFTPTSTNATVNAPRVMDAFAAKTGLNPFSNDLSDNYGTGDVYIGGTNDTSKAIVPSAYFPSNAKTNAP